MIEIRDLHAGYEETEILKGVSLTIREGEIHSIMGPNGSGKSTLSKVLVGHPDYEVNSGTVQYQGKDLLELDAEERAQAGIFMAFQQPVEIPGVNNAEFLHMAYNAKLKREGKEEIDPLDFELILNDAMRILGMEHKYKDRGVNSGFSGGEKKKNEVLQMAILKPRLAILDEIDSGLDLDALKIVASSIQSIRDSKSALLIITHYPKLLDYIVPDRVHVLRDGVIVQSGEPKLAKELEEKGYDFAQVK